MPEFIDEIIDPHFLEYSDAKVRLGALSEKVQLDLLRLDYPKEDWVPPFRHHLGTSVFDVAIVGAGQGGLAAGLALWRERIRNILIIDQAKEGSEGPWLTFARMKTLRTPKYLTGPDTGIPDLTSNAWYSAWFSSPDWSDVLRIPREMWMAYLRWFRASLDLPIKNGTQIDFCCTGCARLSCFNARRSKWYPKSVYPKTYSGKRVGGFGPLACATRFVCTPSNKSLDAYFGH